MNMESTSISKIISPADIKPADIDNGTMLLNEIFIIIRACNTLATMISVINLIICLFTVKKIANNKMFFIVSVIFFIIGVVASFSTTVVYNHVENKTSSSNIWYYIMCVIMILNTFIQILIFTKLIINIKNKKKEENPKCQE